MTSSVYTVSEDASLEEVVRLMERHRIKRLPVVRGRSVFGIITRANVMRSLIHVPLEAKPLSADDTVTRERLLSELEKQPWAPLATINVFVKDGVVRLSGARIDERARLALRVVAENIPGVKKVEDDMVWIEPTSGMVVEPMPT